MRHVSYIKVTLECGGCGQRTKACVQVEREVPEPLRCSPGGQLAKEATHQTAPARLSCAYCGRVWAITPEGLVEDVSRATARGGWGEFIRQDGVELVCKVA